MEDIRKYCLTCEYCERSIRATPCKNCQEYSLETDVTIYNNWEAATPEQTIGLPKAESEPDNVNKPQHYNDYPVEVIDIIDFVLDKAAGKGISPRQAAYLANEIKYRLRAGLKDESKIEEDIKKALWYRTRRLNND